MSSTVYYNITIDKSGIAKIDDNRVSDILKDPSKWELAVERLRLPSYSIPYMIFRNDWKVKIEDTGTNTVVTKDLVYIPTSNRNLPEGQAIWNVGELIEIVNVGLNDAFDELKTLVPAIDPTQPPFIAKTGNLCTFNTQQNYGNVIRVYFNSPLFFLFGTFQSFEIKFGQDTYYQIISKDNYNNKTQINGVDYYSTLSEASPWNLQTDFQSILFETNSVPVSYEQLGTAQNKQRQLLTDLEINSGYVNGQVVQYNPAGPLRYHDLNSSYPLRQIDLKIQWLDKLDNVYPVFTSTDEVITCKLQFRKKIEFE